MTEKTSLKDDVVRQLANILNDTHLTEIEYEVEGCRIRVARQATVAHVNVPPMHVASTAAAPAVAAAEPAETPPVGPISAQGAVKSPMVGTAYMAATPGGTPFVSIGTSVSKGQTLMIIEAMKVMNQIKAPQDGVVKQILVKDGDPVEYGQVLIVLE
jgi:acetyl-CoA carboxylase biotin carboxyl carrier protein